LRAPGFTGTERLTAGLSVETKAGNDKKDTNDNRLLNPMTQSQTPQT